MRISDWSSDVCSSDLRSASGANSIRPRPAAKPFRENLSKKTGESIAGKAAGTRPARRRTVLGPDRSMSVRIEPDIGMHRSEEHTSELQSLMRNSYSVFCLKKKKKKRTQKEKQINN